MAASWWGGFLQTAKEKSIAALDMVRKDLTEFGTTMQNDAGHVVELTSSTLKDSLKTENTSAAKEKMTKGVNTFLERLSQALVVPPDDEGQIPITTSSADPYDRTKARIHAIQLDPGTYLKEPSGAQETYGMWCEGFELEEVKGDLSELLVSKAEVRALYTKLVPSQVSHVDFWRRYFYKLHQMDVEQARKEALMKRADSAGAEDSISWDDDWSGDEAMAEDSGSDWEKLPRPGHHRHSPSPSTPSPPLSPVPSPTQRTKDSENVVAAASTAEISPGDEASKPPGREGKEEKNQQEQRARLVEITKASEEVGASSVGKYWEESSVPEEVSSGEQDFAGGGPLLPSKPTTDSFKDYLQLAATADDDSEKTTIDVALAGSERREDLSSAARPVQEEAEEPSDKEAARLVIEVKYSHPDLTATPSSALPAEKAPEKAPDASAVTREEESTPQCVFTPPSPTLAEEEEEGGSLRTTDRGDLVVVGSDHGSPVSNASGSKVADSESWYAIGLSDVDDEWEQDLDIELTEEDMKEAEDLAKKLGDNITLEDDDWENWE
ncbi:hypothetical protein ACOMHN_052773 [Nucella lapillus]